MLGVRVAPLLLRAVPQSMARLSFLPKFHLTQANLESTSLLQRTTLMPYNLLIKNILEMLEKIKDETEKAQEIDITSFSLIGRILKISHIKNRISNGRSLLQ